MGKKVKDYNAILIISFKAENEDDTWEQLTEELTELFKCGDDGIQALLDKFEIEEDQLP